MAATKVKPWGTVKPGEGSIIDRGDPISQSLLGCWLFNESGGQVAFDIACGKDGILNSGVTRTVGNFGKGLRFDGTTGYVNIGSISGTDPLALTGGNYTFSFWFYPLYTGDEYGRFIDKSTSGSGESGYAFYMDHTTHYLAFRTNGEVTGATSNLAPTVEKWSHIVMTKSSGTNLPKFYINAVQTGYTATDTLANPPASTAELHFGSWYSGSTRNFSGGMDGVRIYNRVLTLNEINRLYSEPFAGILEPKIRIRSSPAVVPPTGGFAYVGRFF